MASTPQRPTNPRPRSVSPSGRGICVDPMCGLPAATCICSICTCGKHACPSRAEHTPSAPLGDSVYKTDFPPHAVSPRCIPPRVAAASPPSDGAKFDGATVYTENFKAHAVAARQPTPKVVQSPTPGAGDARFDGTTSCELWAPRAIPPARPCVTHHPCAARCSPPQQTPAPLCRTRWPRGSPRPRCCRRARARATRASTGRPAVSFWVRRRAAPRPQPRPRAPF